MKQLIDAGAIGKVKLVKGQICIKMTDVKRLCVSCCLLPISFFNLELYWKLSE